METIYTRTKQTFAYALLVFMCLGLEVDYFIPKVLWFFLIPFIPKGIKYIKIKYVNTASLIKGEC